MRGSPLGITGCTGQIFGLTEGLLIHEASGEGNLYPYLARTKGLFAGRPESARTINELLAVIRGNHPEYLPAVMKAVEGFNPYLIVNRVPRGIDPEEVAGKIQHVTKRWLTRDVTFLGGIARHPDVERSAIDLVPAVTRYPKGAFAGEIAAIAKRLLATGAHS